MLSRSLTGKAIAVAALALPLVSLVPSAHAAPERRLTIINNSRDGITQILVSEASKSSWTEDDVVLDDKSTPFTLDSGDRGTITPRGNADDCRFDIKAVFSDGDEVESNGPVDFCAANATYTFSDR